MTRKDMEHLLHQHGKAIYGFCCHLTGSRDEGEELYQETMLKAVELMDRIKTSGEDPEGLIPARNYCLGIAVRLYKNMTRKEARRTHVSLDDESAGIGYVISDDLSLEELAEKEQRILLIRDAIRSLPEKLREVVYLAYYAEQTMKEIALTLHIPQGTVKSRMNDAKKRLEKLLKEKIW